MLPRRGHLIAGLIGDVEDLAWHVLDLIPHRSRCVGLHQYKGQGVAAACASVPLVQLSTRGRRVCVT
jgi:hypothetical protein